MSQAIDPVPAVSVILCTRDRPEDLTRCLDTILANRDPSFELIVTDQSGNDDSQRIIDAVDDARLVSVRLHSVGKARALNAALRAARADVLALTDDDCTVPSDWLDRGMSVLATEPDAGIVLGALEAVPHDPGETYIPSFRPRRYRRFRGQLGRDHYAGKGANMFVRRAVYDRVGPYDESIGPGAALPAAEDTDLTFRALGAGFSIVEDPENVVLHWGRHDYAAGGGKRYVAHEYYAVGACYGRITSRGEPAAAYLFLQHTASLMMDVLNNALRFRRPLGLRHLSGLIRGAVAGATFRYREAQP